MSAIRALAELGNPAELQAGISASGRQGPHAFIRHLNAAYDQQVMIEQWLRPLPAEDDFRLQIKMDDEDFWLLMERLPWDSDFFSTPIARLNALLRPWKQDGVREDSAAAARALEAALKLAKSRGIRYILATVAATDLYSTRALMANGFELIETRCHYHRPLLAPPEKRYPTRLATAADIPSLAKTARVMVNPYDRFHADIEINPDDADRMMEKWVEASILNGFADATIVPDEDAPEAFCTAKYHKQHWDGWGLRLAQPVLSAVAPRHKGWYVKIISELDEHLRSIGAEHSFLITQLTNNAVIRCWEKLGYQFGKGEHVFRKTIQGV